MGSLTNFLQLDYRPVTFTPIKKVFLQETLPRDMEGIFNKKNLDYG